MCQPTGGHFASFCVLGQPGSRGRGGGGTCWREWLVSRLRVPATARGAAVSWYCTVQALRAKLACWSARCWASGARGGSMGAHAARAREEGAAVRGRRGNPREGCAGGEERGVRVCYMVLARYQSNHIPRPGVRVASDGSSAHRSSTLVSMVPKPRIGQWSLPHGSPSNPRFPVGTLDFSSSARHDVKPAGTLGRSDGRVGLRSRFRRRSTHGALSASAAAETSSPAAPAAGSSSGSSSGSSAGRGAERVRAASH